MRSTESRPLRGEPRHRAAPRRKDPRARVGNLLLGLAVTGALAGVAPLWPQGGGDTPHGGVEPRRGVAVPVGPMLVPAQSVNPGAVVRRAEAHEVVPEVGSGEFQVATASEGPSVQSDLLYSVEVEQPLPFAPTQVAREIDAALADPRGWGGRLGLTLRRVDGAPGFRILLATPETTDALCAPLETAGRVSCRNGSLVVLNAVRWVSAVPWYADDVPAYRIYLVNHEVGHALGRAHEQCPGAGSPAPVMQQQTYGLQGCRRSVWPSQADLN